MARELKPHRPEPIQRGSRMKSIWFVLTAAVGFSVGCGGGTQTASFKTVTIRGKVAPAPQLEEPEPAPEPEIVDNVIRISDKIHFGTKSARIKRRSYPVLEEVVQVMRRNPEIVIEVQGHTDAMGSDRRNRRLSARRALRVQEFLIRRGISAERVRAVGHGEEQPVADNQSREGRYRNRRVDFVVVGRLEPGTGADNSLAERSDDDEGDYDDDFEGDELDSE